MKPHMRRQLRDWAFRLWIPFVHLRYRLLYCRRHGHLYKMDMPSQCLNCGAQVRKMRRS